MADLAELLSSAKLAGRREGIEDLTEELASLIYEDFNITLERLYKTKDSLINGGNNDI